MEHYQQGLVILREVGDHTGERGTLHNIGRVCASLGQYPQALEHYQQALAIEREVGDCTGEGRTLNNIGLVYASLGQYPQALEHYQQAFTITREVGDHTGEGATLSNIGLVYASLGQYPQALEHYQQALTILRAVGERTEEGATLNNIGWVYQSLGQYPKALEHYQQALTIAKAVDDRAGKRRMLNNIGVFYDSLGQYPKALEHYQQALTIARAVGDRAGEGTMLNNIGLVYDSLGQYPQALEHYQQALTILTEVGDRAGEGTTLNNIGAIYDSLGQYPQALEHYQQTLIIARAVGDRAGEGRTLNNIGLVYNHLGQYPQARAQYQQALTILREVGNRAVEGTTLNNMGTALLEAGQFVAATETLFSAIEVRESLRAPDLSDASKIALIDTQKSSYVFLQQALIAQNQTETALEIAERGRARAFVDLLSRRVSSAAQPIAPSIPTLKQIQQIAYQQNATLVQYSIAYKPDAEARQVWQPSELYIWVIKPTGEITFRSTDLSTLDSPLSTLVNLSRQAIGARDRGYSIPITPVLRQPQQEAIRLQQLYQILIAPIADLLPTDSFDRIIFIPQGELFLVPFAALQAPNGSYLIQAHTLSTAPSIQVLSLTHQLQRDRSIDFSRALIVGNPTMPPLPTLLPQSRQTLSALPRAEQEAIAIAQQLQTQPLIGDAATETVVVQRMATASVIHLATHGLLEYGNPQASGVRDLPGAIVLARSDQDDGLLTSSKILNLTLRANLVVLSACDTGRGDITGDGVIGLSRSLISAGAASVVVSLWKVADHSTEKLMTEFYRRLQQSGKAQALRQAMLSTMRQYPDPIDWAAFTLIGEAD